MRAHLARWFGRKLAPAPEPPFITTVCGDCGAVIIWQEPIIAGLFPMQICRCQAHWVAVTCPPGVPAVSFMHEKDFLKAYGLGGTPTTLDIAA